MRLFAVAVLCFIASSIVAAPFNSDWRGIAQSNDVRLLDNATNIIEQGLLFHENKTFSDNDSAEAFNDAFAFSKVKPTPITSNELLGNWLCRSTQLDENNVFRYTFFKCRVLNREDGVWFEKVSGSQRVNGYLYGGNVTQLVFIGASSVNDDPQLSYNPNQSETIPHYKKTNRVAVIRKISANKMVMIQPNEFGIGFEQYELIRTK